MSRRAEVRSGRRARAAAAPALAVPSPPPGRAGGIGVRAGALAVVVLGLALRLWHVRGALPDFLDEAIPFKTALRMWVGEGRVDWNPHFFNYPSLTIYLQLALQGLTMLAGRAFHAYGSLADYLASYETDPTVMVIAARLVGVAADAVTIACVIRIGERMRRGAGLVAGAVVALAPTMIVTSRSIYTDTVMAAFAVAALERLLAWRESGRRRTLAMATVLAGMAAGSKYPAAVLVVPLACVLIERRGVRGLGVWALACAGALGVFLLTSPFVALDFAAFKKDFLFESFHMASGHLGSAGRRGFLFQLGTLARDVGWLGLALLVVSLARSILGARRAGDRVALWLFALPLGVAISLARVEAERYLMPVIPVVALLGADAALELLGLVPRARRLALPLASALLVAPLVPAGLGAAASGGDDTQAAARRWTEANVTTHEVLLREGYTGALLTRARVSAVSASRGFGAAGPAARRGFLARRAYAAVDLPLVVAGYSHVLLRGPGGGTERIPMFSDPTEINGMFYDLRLLEGVDLVYTSGAVRGRYEADPARYDAQLRWYAFLDNFAERVAWLRPGHGVTGPEIRVYRIGERARTELARRAGPLDPLWWAEALPVSFRRAFEARAVAPGARTGGAVRGGDGNPATWVRGMGAFFAQDVRPFAQAMARELAAAGRTRSALPLAEAIHLVFPEEVGACLAVVACAKDAGEWRAAEAAIDRTLAAADAADPALAALRLERGRVLDRRGEPAGSGLGGGGARAARRGESPAAGPASRPIQPRP